jgi:hypothetical protein
MQEKEAASAERYSDVLEKLRRAEQERLDIEFSSRVRIQEKISEVSSVFLVCKCIDASAPKRNALCLWFVVI